MAHFYATADDLLPIFAQVESKLVLRYSLTGHFDDPAIRSFESGAELPTLRSRLIHSSAIAGPAYLVTERGTVVHPRKLPPIEGKARWAVDQLANPDSTTFLHGGMYSESVLLYGNVATASKSPGAIRLQRAFETAIKKNFERIKNFYVGSHAKALLDLGVRLTIGAESPKASDLQGS